MKVSLVLIVKNEEKNIERCILNVISLVDEVIVVDTGSTDKTIEILNSIPSVKLFHYEWCNDFSKARNYAIEKSSGEYVLVLDSDEIVVEGSKVELQKIMKQNLIGRILIESNFMKDNQEYYSKEYVSRFFPRELRYVGAIHEQLDSNISRVNMEIKVNHNGYFENNKSERNIPLLIKEVNNRPNDPYYLFQLGKELRINNQYEKAFQFLKKAYEITNESAYYDKLVLELINSGKECGKEEVLNIIEKNESILENVTDFHFSKGLYYLEYCLKFPNKAEKYINRIESSFLTCLSLGEFDHTEYVKGTSSYLATYNLGAYYEVTGNLNKAYKYYQLSSRFGYSMADNRLKVLRKSNNSF